MPIKSRQIGASIRIWYIVAAITTGIILATLWHSPTASALGLPKLITTTLPISSTPLEHVVEPITDHTNKLLPVQINSSPATLGVQVSLPSPDNKPTPAVEGNITMPVASESARKLPITTSTTPVSKASESSRVVHDTSNNVTHNSASPLATRVTSTGTPPLLPFTPVMTGVATFLTRDIPVSVQTFSSNITGKKLAFVPLLLSIGILLSTIILVIGAAYAIDRGILIRLGNGRFAHIAAMHDVAQIAAGVVVIVGLVVIIGLLVHA